MTRVIKAKIKTVKGYPIEGEFQEWEGTKVQIIHAGIILLLRGATEKNFIPWSAIDTLKFYHRRINKKLL